MKCPQCQFENPSGMKFCGQCGAKLAAPCPQCGAESPLGFMFGGGAAPPRGPPKPEPAPPAPQSYTPPHLAAQILQSRSALEGERKQVTVLFCDLVGSTSLAERLGPETMHLLLNRFFELALSEVHRYEGTINQFLGDGFMALFGAPIAHEDHARRAALAALGLQKLLGEHRDELAGGDGLDLKVRMGINTGWGVGSGVGGGTTAGGGGGGGTADRPGGAYGAMGNPPTRAARLQQHAEPGAI